MLHPYTPSHKPRVIELFKLNVPKYFDPNEQKDFEEYLNQYGDTYYVVVEDNIIVGCGGYHFTHNNTVGRISWDMFHPDYKGRGLGRELISHCLSKLRDAPTVVTLAVHTSQYAYNFYAKFGFVTTEITKDHWGKGLDLYVMKMGVR